MPSDLTKDQVKNLPLDQKREWVRNHLKSLPLDQKREMVDKITRTDKPGVIESAALGVAQALSLNTIDEAIGIVKGGLRTLNKGTPFLEARRIETELARRPFRQAERENPTAFGAGQVVGTGASLLIPGSVAIKGAGLLGAAGRTAAGAGLGGIAAAGKSEAPVGSDEFLQDKTAGS